MNITPFNPAKAGLRLKQPECGFRDGRGWCPILRRVPGLFTCAGCQARRVPREPVGSR